MGMAENPMESHALQDRLMCAKCGISPKIMNPEKITGEMLSITVQCHGNTETKMISKSSLIFTQKFFENELD